MRVNRFNRINIPSWALASPRYNGAPASLEIQGVRRTHQNLFAHLATVANARNRVAYFKGYMDVAFRLHQWQDEATRNGRLSLKNSYLRFLLGWIYDANSVEGAVLKGWVESRFGLAPTFHREPLGEPGTAAHFRFEKDRAKGLGCTNAIYQQLDLLYEFTQYELAARAPAPAGPGVVTLYRGVNNFEEHPVVSMQGRDHFRIVLNNLNSFTRDFERAWEFGTHVLEAKVPTTKVFFDGSILHGEVLHGEEEVMVIGGEYEIQLRRF